MARAKAKEPETQQDVDELRAQRQALREKTGFDIAQLEQHPDNPNNGDVDAIVESLKTFDQYRPIVVQRSTMFILAGNHTWFAAMQLGWTKILVHFVDCDDDVGLQILLADNNIARKARVDDGQLAKILGHLTSVGKIAGSSYNSEDLNGLLFRLNASAPGDFAELDPHSEFDQRCPRCGFEYDDKKPKKKES